MKNAPGVVKSTGISKTKSYFTQLIKTMIRYRWMYALLLPGVIYFAVFRYAPMYGLKIAFQEYDAFNPAATTWVGLAQFEKLFSSISFPHVFKNTLTISLWKLLFGFPAPIILAILINEFRSLRYKKLVQTALYLPHFISWVILSGIIMTFVNPTTGLITQAIMAMGGPRVEFLTSQQLFVPLLVVTEIYKSMGWGTIIYFAAISSVEADQYEAAIIDGANRFQQAIHITLPSIKPTIVVVFILNLGNILNAGFDQVFMLYSPLVYEVADIIDTFVFRKGILEASYSFSAAAGMFKSVIALVFILTANKLAKRFTDAGLW